MTAIKELYFSITYDCQLLVHTRRNGPPWVNENIYIGFGRQAIEGNRDAGVQVAIDDFGTGYSSLSYLQQMPFDLIKIDKSFIDLIGTAGNSEKICRTIMKMAHEMGKKAVAEGVENREQADFLIENNCDFAQGYFYSHPLPQDEFLAFVAKQDFHTQRRKALEIA